MKRALVSWSCRSCCSPFPRRRPIVFEDSENGVLRLQEDQAPQESFDAAPSREPRRIEGAGRRSGTVFGVRAGSLGLFLTISDCFVSVTSTIRSKGLRSTTASAATRSRSGRPPPAPRSSDIRLTRSRVRPRDRVPCASAVALRSASAMIVSVGFIAPEVGNSEPSQTTTFLGVVQAAEGSATEAAASAPMRSVPDTCACGFAVGSDASRARRE